MCGVPRSYFQASAMDEFSGKRSSSGLLLSRKEPSRVLRDSSLNKEQNPRLCSRLGCCGRLNSPTAKEVGNSDKAKSARALPRSLSRKEILGSSSRQVSAVSSAGSPLRPVLRKSSPRIGTNSSDNSGAQVETVSLSGKSNQGIRAESSDASSTETGRSSVGTKSRVRRNLQQNFSLASPASSSSPKEELMGINTRYGLRGVRSNSSSSSSSSSTSVGSSLDSNLTRKKDAVNKIGCEGESSSSPKGKKLTSARGSVKGRNNVTVNDSQPVSPGPLARENLPSSVRDRRSSNNHARSRVINGLRNGSNRTLDSSPTGPLMSQTDANNMNDSRFIGPYAFEGASHLPFSYDLSGPSNETLQTRPASPLETTNNRSSLSRENMRRYNMEGIAEVLLALDRIENDEELSYEQLLFLETNLFLSGLNYFDQHRDMRLDIDNMSYEELLALEERMGSVNTALSEEALSECLKISIHHSACDMTATALVGNDRKCCICQEEYMDGDEVGSLHCDHRFHVPCVQQWLRQKNWCPICKASAEPAAVS